MSTLETMQNSGQGGSGIEFDESKFKLRSRRILGAPEVPTMVKFLVNNKFVKNENQAVAVLLGLCLLIIAATIVIFNNTDVPTAIMDPNL